MYKTDNELDKIPNSFDSEAFVMKYFKVTQKCTADSNPRCYPEKYKTISGETEFESSDMFNSDSTYMLADGAVMGMRNISADTPGNIYVDVNGMKGPNIVGYDLQSFSFFSDGSIDEGLLTPTERLGDPETVKNTVEGRFETCKNGTTYGGCFGHLLRNGFRFDY